MAVSSRKARAVFGLFKFLIAFGVGFLVFGFIAFLISVSRAAPADPLPKADGIVVLTGDGGRLFTAGELLTKGKAERLLVSGVDASVPPEDIRGLLGLELETFERHVDLDSVAKDTIGNARETAIWAKALGYEHIILVTSNYHMPRAKIEITSASGGLRITPYPVETSGATPIYKDSTRLKRLAREYGKLIVIFISRMGDRPDLPPQPEPAPIDIMREAQEPPTLVLPELTQSEAPSESTPEQEPEPETTP